MKNNNNKNPLDDYYENTQNITFEKIENTNFKQTLEYMYRYGNPLKYYGYYKYYEL